MNRTMKGLVVVVGLVAVAAVGCKGKTATPKDGFAAWVAAIEKCDVEAIKAGLTKPSVERLDAMVAQFSQFMPPEKQKDFDLYKEICKGFQPGSVKFVSEKLDDNGTTALITYSKDGRELEAPMRLEEGVWRLDMVGMMTRAATMQPPAPAEAQEAPAEAPAAAVEEAPAAEAAPAQEEAPAKEEAPAQE